MMAAWAPLLAVAPAVTSVERLRDIVEGVLAEMPVPDDLAVRPVRAGGVPSLVVAPGHGDEPALLHVHGGGFVLGSAYGYRPLVAGVVAAAGTAVVADSSGCALVLALVEALRAAGEPLPGGVVLMCPSLGATAGMHELAHPLTAVAEAARACAASGPTVLTGLPPLLVQCASDDKAAPDAEELAQRARSAGVDVRLVSYPAGVHMFQLFWSFFPAAAEAMATAGEFVRSVLASAGEASTAP